MPADVPETPAGSGEEAPEATLKALERLYVAGLAESYAMGNRCFTVAHGPIKTSSQREVIHKLHAQLRHLAADLGGSTDQLSHSDDSYDHSTWWWRSSADLHADVIAGHAEHLAHQLAWPGWKITQDPF